MRWIVHLTSGTFLRGGAVFAEVVDPDIEQSVDIPDTHFVNPTLERYDPTSPTKTRWMTNEEKTAAALEARDIEVDKQKLIQALARATWEELPTATRPTFAAFVQRIKVIYRGL
jgi:hypothetical protein